MCGLFLMESPPGPSSFHYFIFFIAGLKLGWGGPRFCTSAGSQNGDGVQVFDVVPQAPVSLTYILSWWGGGRVSAVASCYFVFVTDFCTSLYPAFSLSVAIREGTSMSSTGTETKTLQKELRLGLKRAPSEKPPFTLLQLKKAVPPHCFERSLLRSGSYLAFDLLIAGVLFYLTRFLVGDIGVLGWVLWPAYWIAQGCILTGVWVIAHECGHHAFSDYAWVDDLVGLVLHSWLLVPYFSWKYSHRRHHSNTGSIDRDEVFVPKLLEDISLTATRLMNNPLGRILAIVVSLTLGWPLYLLFNVSGRKYDRFASHFYPESPIFNNREKTQVLVSDLALTAVCFCLYRLASVNGLLWLLKVYGVPLLIVNGFLVLITFLQHTHAALPHYTAAEWEWLRGALSTIDRDYGILNHIFHHITDTHIAHHIFSTMPHYHAGEATEAIKPILGEYYQLDRTPVAKAVWREFKECIYVRSESPERNGILWYTNKLE